MVGVSVGARCLVTQHILIACGTSYQNRGYEISIPLDCFVINEYFLSNCDNRIAIALVGQGPSILYHGCNCQFHLNLEIL